MKILLVQESDWFDRGVHQQHHLMERLIPKGHEVRVIDFEIAWAKKTKRELYSKRRVFDGVSKVGIQSGVKVIRPGVLKLPLLDYISMLLTHSVEIRRQLEEFHPDVVIGMGILNAFIAMAMTKPRKIPFLYYLIDALHTLIPFKRLRFVGKFLESNTLRQCNVACVINDELKRYSMELGAKAEKVHVVRAGIDLKRFNPRVDGFQTRKRLGLDQDDTVLFFMGWLYPFSGLKEVATELVNVSNKQPRIKLLIVGKGDIYDELQRIKRDFNLEQLILASWQPYDKIPEFIAASDICLLPAHRNDVMKNIVPIKMYEYMAGGKPVIATELPGLVKEFGYNNGVMYVEHPADVLKKVIELLNNSTLIEEYGAKARNFVKRHSWDQITDDFEDILKNSRFPNNA